MAPLLDSERIEEIYEFVRAEKRWRIVSRTIKLTLLIMTIGSYYMYVIQWGVNVGNVLKNNVLPSITPIISTLTSQVMTDVTKQMGLPPLPSAASHAPAAAAATTEAPVDQSGSTAIATGSGAPVHPALQNLSPRQVQQLRSVLCQ